MKNKQNKQSMSDYIAHLASICNVYTGEIVQALVTAQENGKANCNDISIECRDKTNNINTFLVKHGTEVAAQFRISDESLGEVADSIVYLVHYPPESERFMDNNDEISPSFCIKDLRVGLKHVSLHAKVLEVSAPKQLHSKLGNIVTLAKALISDETGKIHLCLWDEQIQKISVNDTIVIEDARVTKYNDMLQLNVSKNGKITKEDSLSIISPSLCEMQVE